jgi:hypothetical protein
MSEKIKIKAWDKIHNRMWYGGQEGESEKDGYTFQTYFKDGELKAVIFRELNVGSELGNYVEEIELLLMEYIGLHDRIVRKENTKAKEIYRCDIIKALNRNYDCEDNKEKYFQLFEVTYLNGCYMFGNWNAHEFFNRYIYIEDLGSKFENPKLLQVN